MSRYAVKETLGQGGMGEVLLVRDSVVGRDVALKRLQDEWLDDADAVARFEREARVQGELDHPSVVPVYDLAVDEEGRAFFTMKRVRGESLQEVLDQMAAGQPTRFTRRRLLSAFSRLCTAVHYAHERGVVHRDIKPANVMLGAYDEVYLLDWGIAKLSGDDVPPPKAPVSERSVARGIVTEQGDLMGSVSTMAPEQARGEDVDARADVYALGAILFEILTLQPFHQRGSVESMVIRIAEGVEARPSVRVPDSDVPPELEQLCVEATRFDREERLPSAMLLHDGIEKYLDGDRDAQLRREMARRHADAAKEATDRLLERGEGEDPDARTGALRDVGRALALDPGNREALGTLVRLVTSPPATVPKEVLADQWKTWRRQLRVGGIAGAAVYGYISLNALSTWQLGVHDVRTFTIAHVLWACAFIASLVTIWKKSYVPLFVAFFFGTTTCAFVTNVYSPFVMVPTLLTTHAVLFSLVRQWRLRIVIIATTCATWTASVFGDKLGLFAKTVTFVDGDMVIHSPVIALPERYTSLYLWAATLAMIIAPAIVIGALRSAYHRSDEQMRLLAWQLKKLVSDESDEP